jgi:hypothetical protein
MKTAVLLLTLIAVLLFGEWTYRSFIRPIDHLDRQVLKLAELFSNSGLVVRPYAVRHGFWHSQVTSAAALEIANSPLVVSIVVCPSQQAAVEAMAARVESILNTYEHGT